MILGLGTDIVEVARIQASHAKLGEAFLTRILLANEIAYCQSYRNPAPQIAARFAAKEAVSKAFGTGLSAALSWHDIEIAHEESGCPIVVLHGRGKALFAARGAKELLISLSHTEHYATATAILAG
jgi:holo-[acyl-carrier protein] synthase